MTSLRSSAKKSKMLSEKNGDQMKRESRSVRNKRVSLFLS